MQTVHWVFQSSFVAVMLEQYLRDRGGTVELIKQQAAPLELGDCDHLVVDSEALVAQEARGLQAQGARVLLHMRVDGSETGRSSWTTLQKLLQAFEQPCVVWLDRAHGSVQLERWEGYQAHQARIAATITIPRQSVLFEQDLGSMLAQRQTFDEALGDSSLTFMSRQRLKMTRRALWQHIDVAGLI